MAALIEDKRPPLPMYSPGSRTCGFLTGSVGLVLELEDDGLLGVVVWLVPVEEPVDGLVVVVVE